mgnify:CR=1 FL=1
MANRIGELDLDDAAKQVTGNWQDFESFVWFRSDIPDAGNWSIIYHSHRDSGLLDQSNASVIETTLEPFTDGDDPDVVMESHNHSAVGHIDGFSIRVFREGEITDAFRKYYELAEAMDAYPILNEEDYSRREYEATTENLDDCVWRLKDEYELQEGWENEVYSWFSDNDCGEIENTDDQGGYPSEESLRTAFDALGFQQTELARN